MNRRDGTSYEERDGQLVCVRDRTGRVWAELAWQGPRLVRLAVPGAEVRGEVVRDPLLGDAHAIGDTTMSALDWARPTEIPTLAAPGRLAPGAGGAVMNVIAVLAARAGVTALRYAGPYPTAALWRTLARSFRTAATEEAFTRDAMARAARLDRTPIAIDFAPAPHERVAIAGGHVELRDALERATLGGLTFERDAIGSAPARLVEDAGALRCEIWFGDAPYAHVATLDPDGALRAGPHPIPPCASAVVGTPFPPALATALADLVAELVPAPLGAAARAWLAARPLRWADLGGQPARTAADAIEVHAALWDRLAPRGLARLALALAEALTPLATRGAVAALERSSLGR